MRQCDMKWRTGSYYHKGNSKLCPCPTKSLLSDKNQLARPEGRGNPLQSRGFWKRKKVQTNNLMHYGENNRDKDRQETQE